MEFQGLAGQFLADKINFFHREFENLKLVSESLLKWEVKEPAEEPLDVPSRTAALLLKLTIKGFVTESKVVCGGVCSVFSPVLPVSMLTPLSGRLFPNAPSRGEASP